MAARYAPLTYDDTSSEQCDFQPTGDSALVSRGKGSGYLLENRNLQERLSDDVLVKIFRALAPRDLASAAKVCRQWSRVSLQAWETVYRSNYTLPLRYQETAELMSAPPSEATTSPPKSEKKGKKGIFGKIVGTLGFGSGRKSSTSEYSCSESGEWWRSMCREAAMVSRNWFRMRYEIGSVGEDLAHKDGIRDIAVWKSYLITASEDRTISIWNTKTGKKQATLAEHGDGVTSLAVIDDLLLSGSVDRSVMVWDLQLAVEDGAIASTSATASPSAAPSSSSRSRSRSREYLRGPLVREVQGHGGSVWCVAVARSTERPEDLCLSGCADAKIRVWNLSDGRTVGNLLGHTKGLWSLQVDPQGEFAYSSANDGTIRAWSLASLECLSVLKASSHPVMCIRLTRSGERLYSSTSDGEIRYWEVDPETRGFAAGRRASRDGDDSGSSTSGEGHGRRRRSEDRHRDDAARHGGSRDRTRRSRDDDRNRDDGRRVHRNGDEGAPSSSHRRQQHKRRNPTTHNLITSTNGIGIGKFHLLDPSDLLIACSDDGHIRIINIQTITEIGNIGRNVNQIANWSVHADSYQVYIGSSIGNIRTCDFSVKKSSVKALCK